MRSGLRGSLFLGLVTGLLLTSAGCRHGTGASGRYAPRPGGAVPLSSVDSILRDAPFDLAARLTGVPLLRSVVLAPGTRELRIADWYGMIAGSPVPFLSVVENAAGATGTLMVARDCNRRRSSREVEWCARVIRSAPGLDWRVIARRLDSLGVWDLSEPCEADRVHYTDSGALKLQRLQGAVFSTYSCNTPSVRSGSVGGRARAIYELFHELVRRYLGSPRA